MDRRIYRELNGPKMTEVQISQYLERIEMDKPAAADLEYLTKLQSANVNHIPYENLDILAGREISLDREHLFEKIIFHLGSYNIRYRPCKKLSGLNCRFRHHSWQAFVVV